MGYLKRMVDLLCFRKKWRKNNAHNQTSVIKKFDLNRVVVGRGTYGRLDISMFDEETDIVLEIGNYCSIAGDVKFICGGNHYTNRILTYPIDKKIFAKDEALSKGKIVVEDDVWIGTNAMILSGVRIGRGSVVAAGSVVVDNVPPYSIVGGVPAKVIKYRFEKEMIDKLMLLQFDKIDNAFIQSHRDLFNCELNMDILDEILKELG